MPRVDAALTYANRGWAVLPLRGKLPAIPKAKGGRGVHDATTNSDTIKAWWAEYPDANIGVATGRASGIWVLDVDGDEGEQSLAELQGEHGPIPDTVEQLTGNGRHLLFRFNGEQIKNSVKILPGLDTRADGGYIVVAPSHHQAAGRPYIWEVDHDPEDIEAANAPDWLLKFVAEKPGHEAATTDPYLAFGRSGPKSESYGRAALEKESEAVAAAPTGRQEHTLNAAALKIGQLVGSGALDFSKAAERLVVAGLAMPNEPQKKPWTESEIRAKVERGLRDGMANPRHPKASAPSEPPKDPSRLKPLHWSELGNLPVRESLVKGVLDRSAFSVIYGPTNCGKTFMALDIAARVALGWEWFRRKVRQGSVIYIAAEGGLGIAERLAAFQFCHEIEPDAPLYIVPAAIDLCKTRGDAAELVKEIKQFDPEKIVVDTLSRTLAGGNENSPDDMGAFVGNCDFIRQETGAHLMVIHHTGKDESRGTRGHSLLLGAADTLIEVSKDEVSGLITATVKKQRDRAGGETFTFKLDPIDIGMDEDEDTITSCVVVPVEDASPTRQGSRITGQAKIAFDLLRKAIEDTEERPPPCRHRPDNLPMSGEALWRRYCYTGGLTDSDNPDTQQKTFVRAKQKLLAQQVIGIWDEWVWIVR